MATRVLMFGWELPPNYSGGLGAACQGLARALIGEGVEVIFVLPRDSGAALAGARIIYADIAHMNVRHVGAQSLPYVTTADGGRRFYIGKREISHGGLVSEVLLYAAAARLIARQETFDIIHAHDWLSFAAGIAAKEESGKPLIAHVHATQFDHNGGNEGDPVLHAIEKEGLEKSDRIIAVSDFTKKMLVRNYGINDDKIDVVHNGMERTESSPGARTFDISALKADGSKIVLFMGRITLMKGPDYFIKAAQKVLKYEPKTYFILAGTGDMERRMVELAAELGISDRVLLIMGFVQKDMRQALYHAADLFVLPSVSEPFGITPLEAIDVGTPVLISRQSGVSEVLQHALKVDFWDTDDMADKIIGVLRNDALGVALIQNAARELIRVNWNAAAKKVQQVYRSILDFFKKRQRDG